MVDSSSDATEAARVAAETADVVVAVGGDGTVADVATGIFGSTAALAIVPAGSTNITARSLSIPSQLTAAIAVLVGPHALRRIDLGRSAGRSFLHMAGAGFDAELFGAASPSLKRRLGWVAYLPAAASALRLAPSAVSLVIDGRTFEARSPLVLVANGNSAIAPALEIYPGIANDDGWLDVLIFTPSTPAQIAATLASAGRRQLAHSPYVTSQRVKRVRIDAEPSLSVELDGDVHGWTPREFYVVPHGISIVTPIDRIPVETASG
ncbi:MAG: hypothetical protein H0T18_04965 [Chloroflexia bacterium]|nr:hypothetical protein [Chloroflexia bacterium]